MPPSRDESEQDRRADRNEDDLPREIPFPAAGQLLAEGGDSRTLGCRPEETLDLPVDRDVRQNQARPDGTVEPHLCIQRLAEQVQLTGLRQAQARRGGAHRDGLTERRHRLCGGDAEGEGDGRNGDTRQRRDDEQATAGKPWDRSPSAGRDPGG